MAVQEINAEAGSEHPESMPTVDYYLAQDPRTPDVLFERSTRTYESGEVSTECFVSKEWHRLEVERLWKRVWQMACRENDIPKVGDYVEYTIADQSVIVVRDNAGVIRAFQNACLHRGPLLVEGCGNRAEFECTFHAWTWSLDGAPVKIPCRWDFPDLDQADLKLPEYRVGTWNGFVFITFDPDAPSLEEYIGDTLPRHFALWPTSPRWKAVHVTKKVPCNWKVAMEAFIEDYHVFRTHPNVAPYAGDCNSQYDIFDDLHGRMITCMGVTSPHLAGSYSEQDVVDSMVTDVIADVARDPNVSVEIPRVSEGSTARQVLAEFMRQSIRERTGVDLSDRSDAEVLDAIEYHIFPNLVVWGGFSFPLVYRYRPAGNDPDWSYFDVMIFTPMPDGEALPKDNPARMLPSDEPWSNAAELGSLGPVYDQDMVNLPKVQKGLHSDRLDVVHFSDVQERNIRNLHANIKRYIDG